MDHPPAVIEKAQRLEQLLQRAEQGEALAQVSSELEVAVTPERLTLLRTKYEEGGRTWEVLLDGRYGHEQKVTPDMKEWLYERKRQDETLSGPQLAAAIEKQFKVELSVGHINLLLRQVGLSRQTGRPPGSQKKKR